MTVITVTTSIPEGYFYGPIGTLDPNFQEMRKLLEYHLKTTGLTLHELMDNSGRVHLTTTTIPISE